MALIRVLLTWLVVSCGALLAPAAEAAVICSFSGSGSSGTDCLGNAWSVGNGGWGIPGIGLGIQPFAGNVTATDFHFHCLTGCGPIQNGPGADTRFSLSPFGSTLWSETLNGAADTIDFVSAPGIADDLTPGRSFFVNITTAINLTNFSFEASWTNDQTAVPEPASMALVLLAMAGLALQRARKSA